MARARQKTMRGPYASASGAGLGLGLGLGLGAHSGASGNPLGASVLPLVDQPLPVVTAAAVSNAAAAVVAASLTDSDSDDPTSGHTRRRFALFDRDDDDDDEEEEEGRARRRSRSRSRDASPNRLHRDADAHMYDAQDASVTIERERERARARRMLVVPGPKKRSVSFSSIYRALQVPNGDILAHLAAADEPSSTADDVANQVSQSGNGGDGEKSAAQKKWRDPNNLGPKPHKLEAHGRFQLWVVGILYWLAIVLQLCSLWSEDWVEDSATLLGRRGKDLVQWLLLALAIFAGLIGYVCIMLRFHGVRWASNAMKWVSIACLFVQGAAANTASEMYLADHGRLIEQSGGSLQYGSSYSFTVLSRSYCAICIALLLWQEIVEFLSRRHAYKLADSLQKLKQLRTDAHARAEAKVEAAAAAALVVATTPNPDGSVPSPGSDEAAAAAATAAADAAEYADAETLAGSQQFLSELSKLGVSVESGRQLNLDALPTPESVSSLAATLYQDKDYLSRGQRRLVWTSIVFFFVIFGGGMLYAELEGWNARASIDFAIVSLATIGYGNSQLTLRTDRCMAAVAGR